MAALEGIRQFVIELNAAYELALDELATLRPDNQRQDPTDLLLRPSDLEGLPQELIDQLSITDSDREDFGFYKILEEAGGAMSLDQLLIAIYKESGTVYDRAKLNQRLYRMSQKKMIHAIQGKKGAYSIKPWHIDSDELVDDDEETEAPPRAIALKPDRVVRSTYDFSGDVDKQRAPRRPRTR